MRLAEGTLRAVEPCFPVWVIGGCQRDRVLLAGAGEAPSNPLGEEINGPNLDPFAELASFKRPDGLTLVDDLPLTVMYKVVKRAIRAQAERCR